ncbi:MAG: DUF1818 family protein [Synechococcus sp.]|nr:DUF1818 family protein [Synechococcus sp.]
MEIHEGRGWRLRIDPQRRPYGALIGGDLWAVELRPRELLALQRAVARLEAQYLQLQPTLMADEALDLELDLELEPEATAASGPAGPPDRAGCLHVALTAAAGGWALRFVLMPTDGARAVEGGWSAAASPALAAALAGLPASLASVAAPPPPC